MMTIEMLALIIQFCSVNTSEPYYYLIAQRERCVKERFDRWDKDKHDFARGIAFTFMPKEEKKK